VVVIDLEILAVDSSETLLGTIQNRKFRSANLALNLASVREVRIEDVC
jgi:hypothetical protein